MNIPIRTNIFGKTNTPSGPANFLASSPFAPPKKTDQMQPLQPMGQPVLSQSNTNSNTGNFKGTSGIYPQGNLNQPQPSPANIFNKAGSSGPPQNFNYSLNNMASPAANLSNAPNNNPSAANNNAKNPFTGLAKTNNGTVPPTSTSSMGGVSSSPKPGQQNILGINNVFNRGVNANSNTNSMTNSQNFNNNGNNFLNKNTGSLSMSSNVSPFLNKTTNNPLNNQPNNNPSFTTQNNLNQNPSQNVFLNQNPNQSQSPFHNFQHNQQVPQGIGEGQQNYVQQGQQTFQNGPHFQHPGSAPYQNQNVNLFPQSPANDYHIFLNNLVSSDIVNRSNNPKELFQLGEGWALAKNQSNGNDNLPREFLKIFDLKIYPQIHEMAMKQLPPVQITNNLFQKLNEPFACKMILSQLWLRLKEKFDFVVKSVNLANHHCGSIRIKDLPFYKEMLILRNEVSVLAKKVGHLKNKDNQIKRIQAEKGQYYKAMLQRYKQVFSQVNLRAKMMDEASVELDKIQDYVQKSLKPAFKAYIQKQHVSINDPDDFMLDISQYIAKRLNELDKVISDHIVINSDSEEEVINFFELAENVCRFYEEVAAKLYDIREKMKSLIKIAAKYKSFGGYQDLQRKIEEKTKDIVSQKMAIYNKLKEVEDIIENKKQVSAKGKSLLQSPQKLRRSS